MFSLPLPFRLPAGTWILCLLATLACNQSQPSRDTPAATTDSQPQENIINYPNGPISQRVMVVNGMKEGKMIQYYYDGKVKSELWFEHDKQVGRTVVYYPEGQIKEVQYYDKGLKQRGDTIWYASGKIQFTVPFVDNHKHGYLRKWDEDGKLVFESRYDMDSLVEVKGQPIRHGAKPGIQ